MVFGKNAKEQIKDAIRNIDSKLDNPSRFKYSAALKTMALAKESVLNNSLTKCQKLLEEATSQIMKTI